MIQDLGYVFGLKILTTGPGKVAPLPKWARGPGRKFAKPGRVFHGPFHESSDEVRFNAHAFDVCRTAAWICEAFQDEDEPLLIYSEFLLRNHFGWFSGPRKSQSQRYQTMIPDLWVVMKKRRSFRVEFQRTPKSRRVYRKVINDPSHGEPVLYVSENLSIVQSLRKFREEEGEKFGVALLDNAEDMKLWVSFMRQWRPLAHEITNPQRKQCAQLNFRQYLQNPIVHSEHDDWSAL